MNMPTILEDLATMFQSTKPMNCWRRMRFAITQSEWEQIKAYYLYETKDREAGSYAAMAIRGVPLVIEEHPADPIIIVEFK